MFQVQYCAKEMEANFAEIREIRRTNCQLSFQTKKRRNFGSSIVLMSTKFRKQGVIKFRFDDGLTHVKGLGPFQERGTRVCACIITKPFQN